VLFGLAPALRAARVDLTSTLRASARSMNGGLGASAGRRFGAAKLLIASQVALSVVLLTGAALLVRSLRALEEQPTGLDRDHLLIVDLDVGARGYTAARQRQVIGELENDFARLPGVVGVSYSENGIFSGTESESSIAVQGFTARTPDDTAARFDEVGPHYAAAIGARLYAGRDMDDRDATPGQSVALVNQAFARFYYPGGAAVGKFFRMDTTAVQIIGVIGDVQDHDLRQAPLRRFYLSYLLAQEAPAAARFEIRTAGEPTRIAPEIRRIVSGVDDHLTIDGIDPLTTLMRSSVREERLLAQLATGFGLAALLLAAVGLYGVMTYAVTRRTGEIGLRVALGAQRPDVLGMIVGDAIRVVFVGFAVGLPVALGTLRLIGAQLHGVGTADPASIAVALAVLLASALAAVLPPALRASRVSPIVALREE